MIRLGNVAEWLAAVGTLLALVAAGAAAIFAHHQLRLLRDDADERLSEAKKSQAAKVAVWLERDLAGNLVALFRNASDLPIYNVVVTFKSPNNDNDFHVNTFGPTGQPVVLPDITGFINSARAMYPSIDLAWAMQGTEGPVRTMQTGDRGEKTWVEAARSGPIGLGLTFTDAHGYRWERGLDGLLAERLTTYKPFAGGVL